jgi:hypothetical protein
VKHVAEDRALELAGEGHRQDQRERRSLVTHLMFKGLAAGAAVDVRPQDAARRDAALHRGQLLAYVSAWVLSGRSATDERLACLEDERFDLLGADAEHAGDLLLGVVAELKQNQCGALVSGESPHVVEHLAQILAALDLVGQALEDRSVAHHLVDADRLSPRAQLRQAAIARDGVEPGPQCDAVLA